MDRLKTAIVQEFPEVGREFFAIATHLKDINNFYIVSLACFREMNVLEKPGPMLKEVTEYSVVVYNSPILKRHVRGVVQKVLPNNCCIIFAMDYGVIDSEVSPPNIFSLYDMEAENIPGLAHSCELSMCFPRGGGQFSQEALECFKFFMGHEGERLSVVVKERTIAKLGVLVISSESNPNDVSTVLAYTNHSVYYRAPL